MMYDTIREIGDRVYQRMGNDVNVEINAYGSELHLDVSDVEFDVIVIVNGALDTALTYDTYDDTIECPKDILMELEDLANKPEAGKIEQSDISVGEIVIALTYDTYDDAIESAKDILKELEDLANKHEAGKIEQCDISVAEIVKSYSVHLKDMDIEFDIYHYEPFFDTINTEKVGGWSIYLSENE